MQGFNVVNYGFSWTYWFISIGIDISDWEFVEGMPEYFPENTTPYDDADAKGDVANELGNGYEVVLDCEMNSWSGKGVRLLPTWHLFLILSME